MDGRKPLSRVVELVQEECLLCGKEPAHTVIEGPDAIVPQPCGHVHDLEDWIKVDTVQTN